MARKDRMSCDFVAGFGAGYRVWHANANYNYVVQQHDRRNTIAA